MPLTGYEVVEHTVQPGAPAQGQLIGDVAWPSGSLVVGVSEGGDLVEPRPELQLHAGDRVVLLASAKQKAEARPTSPSGSD